MGACSVYCSTCGALNATESQTCRTCGKPMSETLPEALKVPARIPSGQLPPQHLLQGRFRILYRIGAGGFGAVYQGEDTEAGNRRVAIKEMSHAGLSPHELQEATDAFHREAQLLRELEHPSLPRIYAHFSEGGHWYLVMDFIQGETLEVYLARQGGQLPLKEVFDLGIQLCEVLEYLHTRQPPVIFRDLKPANVMLTPHQRVYLIDFGIARHFTPGKQHDTVAFGSPGYAAPEQYGKAQTTARSDIFSLGALLHQLLTGTDPSEQPMRFAPITGPVPAGLAWLIAQMVDLDADQRPASMAAIKAALERLRETWQSEQVQAQANTASSAPSVLASPFPPSQPRSKSTWYITLGLPIVFIILVTWCGHFLANATSPTGITNNTDTAVGITNVKVGVGDAADSSGIMLYESTSFTTNDSLVINFTITTNDSNSDVGIQFLDQSNQLPSRSNTIHPPTGTHDWYAVLRDLTPGTFTLVLQYNYTTEYTSTITVTSPGT